MAAVLSGIVVALFLGLAAVGAVMVVALFRTTGRFGAGGDAARRSANGQ